MISEILLLFFSLEKQNFCKIYRDVFYRIIDFKNNARKRKKHFSIVIKLCNFNVSKLKNNITKFFTRVNMLHLSIIKLKSKFIISKVS